MKKTIRFTEEELTELEALEIKGGVGGSGIDPQSNKNTCTNNNAGCGCSGTNEGCINERSGCGSSGTNSGCTNNAANCGCTLIGTNSTPSCYGMINKCGNSGICEVNGAGCS